MEINIGKLKSCVRYETRNVVFNEKVIHSMLRDEVVMIVNF
jgi:malate synthase